MFDESCIQLERIGEETVENRSILIIDDDESQVEVLMVRLASQGFTPLAATCGEEGLSLAREQCPNLILLDLRLPDTDGFTVCEQLADDPQTNAIPVIILSGMERPDVVRRSRAVGGHFYVRKPYDPNALLVLIEQAIREAST